MSEFETWFKSLNKNGRVTYFLGQEGRVSEEAWNHQQTIINDLKAQLECCRKENAVLLEKVGALQGQIDGAIKDLTRPCYTQAGKIDDALKALRGAND